MLIKLCALEVTIGLKAFTLLWHAALVVRKHGVTIQIKRYPVSLLFDTIQFLKSTRRFRNMRCFTGKGYWPFAQPPTTRRARCCNSSDLSLVTCPARLNLSQGHYGTQTSYQFRVQHLGRTYIPRRGLIRFKDPCNAKLTRGSFLTTDWSYICC